MQPDLRALRTEWKLLRDRYGSSIEPAGVARLELSRTRRINRIRHLRDRVSELTDEIRVLRHEVEGIDKALCLALEEAIGNERHVRGEAWSPIPIPGFRLWDLRGDGLFGFRVQWSQPTLVAQCPTTKTSHEVPHTDGSCGDPPCGIYATKDADSLLDAHCHDEVERLAIGLVGLTGKVVEHEFGYRAARADVIALSFVRNGVLHTTADHDEMTLLFGGHWLTNPGKDFDMFRFPAKKIDPTLFRNESVAFLEHQKERMRPWTSVNRNE